MLRSTALWSVSVPRAGAAGPVINDLAAPGRAGKRSVRSSYLLIVDHHIKDSVAFPAQKMTVFLRPEVIVIRVAAAADPADLPVFTHLMKITVYGGKTDIRIFLSYLIVYLIGRGMCIISGQVSLDCFSLS